MKAQVREALLDYVVLCKVNLYQMLSFIYYVLLPYLHYILGTTELSEMIFWKNRVDL